jgi:hypothetical protein
MTAVIYYDGTSEQALLNVTFTLGGVPSSPGSVSCVVTDPSGTVVTHTYQGAAPADVVLVSPGTYQLSVTCSPAVTGIDGLWGYCWIAAGIVNDIQPGTWRVLPAAISQLWYIGLEEMADRLGITDSADNSSMQTAIAASAGWINSYCGRTFNRVTETRTFVPVNVWLLETDDIVPGAPVTVRIDTTGDGIFDTPLILDTDFQLRLGDGLYNVNASGQPQPYTQLQIINSGVWLPFTWPYSHLDRVQIQTTWGWPAVPWQVTEANRILAADLFKGKDAPFGLAGSSDLGVVRIGTNPWLVGLLHNFVRGRRKVGV